MQMGTNPAQDVPAAKLGEGSIKKTDTPGKLVGSERITVPAGTFDTKHYKHELPKEAGGMTLDVWMSDKAVPTGVVKMSGAGGIEMVLSKTGTGAKKTEISGEKTVAPAAPASGATAAPASGSKAATGKTDAKSSAPAKK
jgi:hypothetical protein